MVCKVVEGEETVEHRVQPDASTAVDHIIIIIIILTAIGLAPGGSSPVHIYREHYIEYTNNTQNT